jgi:L-asparaginase II
VSEPVVVFTRGGLPESEHRLIWCVAESGTAVTLGSEPSAEEERIFARSATKPMQALPAVTLGVLERFGLDDRHLAIGCSSHGGTEEHTRLVTEMLAACGLTEGDLGCGPLDPRDPVELSAMRARGGHPSRITHNCSGKHALGLATCVAQGWPIEDYLRSGHPLQTAMREAVAESAGAFPDEVAHGTDGCGMCTFHLPLGDLARAYGRLASGDLGDAGSRVARAMREHAHLVAFDGAVDTELMRAGDGLVAKVGAEGVIAAGLPDGRGLALKVRDGAMRALDPAAVAVVRGALALTLEGEALDRLAEPVVLNSLGEVAGDAQVRL